MGVDVYRGEQTSNEDFRVQIEDGDPFDPYFIAFVIYDNTIGRRILLGAEEREPEKISTGLYAAVFTISNDANLGEYQLDWIIQEHENDPRYVRTQRFGVVGKDLLNINTVYSQSRSGL